MMQRRDMVGGGLAAGLMTLVGSNGSAAQRDEDVDVARAIGSLRETIEEQFKNFDPASFPAVEHIRQQQRIFLKTAQKFPDFIEVGIEVWEQMVDWHVRHRQPIGAVRLNDGHYGMAFMFTTLVLRPEQPPGYVGWGYDVR
jgi:hypothetical protein